MVRFVRQWILRIVSFVLTALYRVYRVHPVVWRWTATHYHPRMERFARRHAWMTCQFAALDVPAYKDYLRRNDFRFRWFRLDSYPETSKEAYVKAYPEDLRCWQGELEISGTVVDESSGSSGTPYNWLRSRRELNSVHKNVAGYTSLVFPRKKLFVINAYSMGAWATGTNTGIAMSRIAMVKNTGPDLDKIVDTIRHFGPRFTYLVTAYPPFLKHLRDRLDADGFDWRRHRMYGFVGGEGMTEALRDYLEERFVKIRSGYGASDLTIGMAGESDLTVWLRRRLLTDDRLRDALLGPDEGRVPMVFQYNPLETYLEINADDEIVCTINSTAVLSPKLRYNIGDEGKLLTFPQLEAVVREDPEAWRECEAAFRAEGMRLPLLMLFGRKDSTVSYMGANIYPQDVEYGLYEDNPLAGHLEGFCLTIDEYADLESRPVVNLQLRDGTALTGDEHDDLVKVAREGVVRHLARVSRDFAQSLAEDPSTADLRVRVHPFGTGPFARGTSKIKNVYLVTQGEAP